MGDRNKQGRAADMDFAANGRGSGDMSDPALLHYLQALEKRQDRHENGCQEERRAAERQRRELREEMQAGFTKIDGSIGRLHERINGLVDATHQGDRNAWDWRLKLAGTLILTLLAVVGYLLVDGRPWAS